jgi:uncharacterized SAM-binding protein YcdF (DUF218 family)
VTSWQGMSTGRRVLTLIEVVVVIVVVVLVNVWISGYFLFRSASSDPLQKADAIVVLGGEHDGREDYGIGLAKDGWARTVVISNPYEDSDGIMKRVCRDVEGPEGPVEVMCRVPPLLTTRGEAMMMRGLADERSWKRIIVVSWQYHLPRARMVFRQCFSREDGATIMHAVARRYRYTLLEWEFVYAYQWGGLAKAIALGGCL